MAKSVTITFEIPLDLRNRILEQSKSTGIRLKQNYQNIFLNGCESTTKEPTGDKVLEFVEEATRA